MNADKIRAVMKASTSGNKMARIYRALEAVVVECERRIAYGDKQIEKTEGMEQRVWRVQKNSLESIGGIIARKLEIEDA